MTHVLIAGAGPAGLETALAVRRLAEERAAITLLTPEAELVYRPQLVAEPFGGPPPRRFSLARIASDLGISLRRGTVAGVDARRRMVLTGEGGAIGYDALVLALGARRGEGIPGAVAFRDVRAALAALPSSSRVAFAAPPMEAWTLPLYELALQTARATAHEVWLVTHEPRPLAVFGARASTEVAELLEDAGVRLWTGAGTERVVDGKLVLTGEGSLPVALTVSLPRTSGRPIAGVPHDGRGFTRVDEMGRVPGIDDVYAVGDMTSRRLKQGGLATQQADATASAIAALAGADVEPAAYRPQLRAVLLTGGAPRYLRGDAVSEDPPFWPPHKIAARHLSPYLAAHPELEVTA